MSNKIQQNNADLQSVLETINALPDAGSGGGGAVETCTVTINNSFSGDMNVWGTIIVDGKITLANTVVLSGESVTLDSVVCGSVLCLGNYNLQTWLCSCDGVYIVDGLQGKVRVCEILYNVNSATIVIQNYSDEPM